MKDYTISTLGRNFTLFSTSDDLESVDHVDKVLTVAQEVHGDEFHRGHIGKPGAAVALTDEQKREQRDFLVRISVDRRRTQEVFELKQNLRLEVSDTRLDILRTNLRRLLDDVEKAKSSPLPNQVRPSLSRTRKSTCRNMLEITDRVNKAREALVSGIKDSHRFAAFREADLHYLNVPSSVQLIDHFLKDSKNFHVITGRGLHSKGRIGLLSKAIEQHLTEKGIRFRVGEDNDVGRIFVHPEKRHTTR